MRQPTGRTHRSVSGVLPHTHTEGVASWPLTKGAPMILSIRRHREDPADNEIPFIYHYKIRNKVIIAAAATTTTIYHRTSYNSYKVN